MDPGAAYIISMGVVIFSLLFFAIIWMVIRYLIFRWLARDVHDYVTRSHDYNELDKFDRRR